MTTRRGSVNVYDYPEHLNPFYEEDNHNKLRFWNVPKKKRSNSFNFQSVKDFKSTLKFNRFRSRSGTTCSLFTTSNLQNGHKYETPRTEYGRKFLVLPKLLQIGRTFSMRKNKNDAPVYQPNQSSPNLEREKIQYQSPNAMKRFTINPKKQQSNYETMHTLPNPRLHERHRYNGELATTDLPSQSTFENDDRNPFNDEHQSTSSTSVSPSSKPRTPPRKKKRAPPPPPLRQSSLINGSSEAASTESDEENLEDSKRDSISTNNSENIEQNEQVEEPVRIITTPNILDNNQVAEEKIESITISNELTKENTTTNSVTIKTSNNSSDNIEQTNEIQITNISVLVTEDNSVSTEKEENLVCIQKEENKIENIPDSRNTADIIGTEKELKQNSDNTEVEVSIVVSESIEKTESILIPDNSEKEEIIIESTEMANDAENAIAESIDECEDLEKDTIMIPDQLIYNSEFTLSGSETSLASDVQLEKKQQQLAIEDSSDLLEMVQKLQLEVQKLTDDTNNNEIPTSPKVKSEVNIQLQSDDFPTTAPLSPKFIRLRQDNAWIKRY